MTSSLLEQINDHLEQNSMMGRLKIKNHKNQKNHISVDMQSALINQVAITPCQCNRWQWLKALLPNGGEVYTDKGIVVSGQQDWLEQDKSIYAVLKRTL